MNPGESISANLDIDAHVIHQLGAELVTDAEQALLELIKNSYDADSASANVVIDTTTPVDAKLKLPGAVGSVVIEDNGTGMSLKELRDGWLMVSLSPKRALKAAGKTTSLFKRTPLGDKGLGRLSTMRLGQIVEITTYSEPQKPGYKLTLRWSDFASGKRLSKIPVPIEAVAPRDKPGTELVIHGLNDPNYWKGSNRVASVQRSISTLLSPFKSIKGFRVSFEVDGHKFKPERLADSLRETATVRTTFSWDGELLTCTLTVKASLFRTADKESFEKLVAKDRGAALFEHLRSSPKAKSHNLRRAPKPWFLELSRSWTWDEIAARKPDEPDFEDPGPVEGEVDSFDLDTVDEGSRAFSKLGEYRAFVKQMAGVRIYRDGFAIRTEDDWLQLGKSWTSGRSYYGLKPSNTVGYVGITAAKNPGLLEKSDREGFIDNAQSRGLERIANRFVKFTNDALNDLRRQYTGFRSKQKAETGGLSPDWETADAVTALRRIAATTSAQRAALAKAEKLRLATVAELDTELRELAKSDQLRPALRSKVAAARSELKHVAEAWEASSSQLTRASSQLEAQGKLADAVLDRFSQLHEQIDDLYDFVAIGLVAQALAHDVRSLLDDLLARTQKVSRVARQLQEPRIDGYLEAVRATSAALRKQLAFLDPMLRGSRETKQDIELEAFLGELLEMRKERFARFGIKVDLRVRSSFAIRFNQGRLLQIFDNLIRNSEYWLRQKQAQSPNTELRITVTIDEPFVLVADNGPGVNRQLEETLFEAFVSDKPRGSGNGLGLFIVAQLLEREGCSIRLDDLRNATGRRSKFHLDFEGVVL